MDCFDIKRDAKHDLLDEALRKDLLDRIAAGYYQAVIMSPPCGTWSRAPWANNHGPRPLRSSEHPFRFPWLESWRKTKVEQSNSMVELCLQCITLCIKHGIHFLLEHPEDLGATSRYGPHTRPASIWQLLPIQSRVHHGQAFCGAMFQCTWGAPSHSQSPRVEPLLVFGPTRTGLPRPLPRSTSAQLHLRAAPCQPHQAHRRQPVRYDSGGCISSRNGSSVGLCPLPSSSEAGGRDPVRVQGQQGHQKKRRRKRGSGSS